MGLNKVSSGTGITKLSPTVNVALAVPIVIDTFEFSLKKLNPSGSITNWFRLSKLIFILLINGIEKYNPTEKRISSLRPLLSELSIKPYIVLKLSINVYVGR